MPGEIHTQAIATVPRGMLLSASLIGLVGEMSVIKAQIYGDDEPDRWGLFVRVGDGDATLICRYHHDGDDLTRSLQALGAIIFNTLHAAHDHRSALLSPDVFTDALLTDDTVTVGAA